MGYFENKIYTSNLDDEYAKEPPDRELAGYLGLPVTSKLTATQRKEALAIQKKENSAKQSAQRQKRLAELEAMENPTFPIYKNSLQTLEKPIKRLVSVQEAWYEAISEDNDI